MGRNVKMANQNLVDVFTKNNFKGFCSLKLLKYY